jgi:hypothetical protein
MNKLMLWALIAAFAIPCLYPATAAAKTCIDLPVPTSVVVNPGQVLMVYEGKGAAEDYWLLREINPAYKSRTAQMLVWNDDQILIVVNLDEDFHIVRTDRAVVNVLGPSRDFGQQAGLRTLYIPGPNQQLRKVVMSPESIVAIQKDKDGGAVARGTRIVMNDGRVVSRRGIVGKMPPYYETELAHEMIHAH